MAATALAPFNTSFADITLRTSDNVDFHVSKVILILASSIFQDMFAQDPIVPPPHGNTSQPPIVNMPETSSVLDKLLRFCYPVDDPIITDLGTLGPVLGTAIKYDVTVINALCRIMNTFLQTAPMEVYKLACAHNLEEHARGAVQYCRPVSRPRSSSIFGSPVPQPVIDDDDNFQNTAAGLAFVPEMANMTAAAYHRLMKAWSPLARAPQPSAFGAAPAVMFGSQTTQGQAKPLSSPTNWAADPLFRRNDADMILRSSDGVDFAVHEIILRLADGAELISWTASSASPRSRRVAQTDVHSETLGWLLRLSYPHTVTRHTTSFDTCPYHSILDTANRLGMKAIVNTVRENWGQGIVSQEDLLGAYLVAARLRWIDEARSVADRITARPLRELFSRELERTPAKIYHSLLEYHHRRQNAIRVVWKKYERSGERWRKEWFTQPTSQVRAVPSVLVESIVVQHSSYSAESVLTKTYDEAARIENEVAAAMREVGISHVIPSYLRSFLC